MSAGPNTTRLLLSRRSLSLSSPSSSSALLRRASAGAAHAMASYNTPYSSTSTSSSSEIATPRSSSPNSHTSRTSRSSATSISKRMSISSQRRLTEQNPLGSIDIAAIEKQLRMASLDGLRGYHQDHYSEVKQTRENHITEKDMAVGYEVLREPAWNRGTFHEFSLSAIRPQKLRL